MIDSLYKEIILDHYRNPRNFGHLEKPTHVGALHNPFCGDRIRVEMAVENGEISDIRFSGEGCVLSIASGSLLTEFVKNKNTGIIAELSPETLVSLLGIEVSPVRLKCVLLPLDVLKKLTS